MVQVHPWSRVRQIEGCPTGQWLAPQEPVIAPERRAVRIGVLAAASVLKSNAMSIAMPLTLLIGALSASIRRSLAWQRSECFRQSATGQITMTEIVQSNSRPMRLLVVFFGSGTRP